jgi:hypothetical protein
MEILPKNCIALVLKNRHVNELPASKHNPKFKKPVCENLYKGSKIVELHIFLVVE